MAKKKKSSLEDLLEQALVKNDDKPHEVPMNWVWSYFKYLVVNRDSSRIPLSQSQRDSMAKIYDYYGASGIIDKVESFIFDKDLLLIGEDGANLVTRSKPIAFIAKGQYWVNNHAHVLDKNESSLLEFLCYYINSIDLVPYVTGTAQPKLTQDKTNIIPIPLPPLPEQQRIVDLIESFFEKLDRAKELVQNAIDSFDERKSAILHEAYSGNLTAKWREENDEEFKRDILEIRHLVTHLNQGWSPKCENYPSTDYEKWGVIKTTAIQHRAFFEGENKQLPHNLVPREKHELKVGDILITRAGPRIRVGVCCLINNVRPRLLLCDKAYRFRANIERVMPEYLVLALNTPEILDEINLMKTGISESGVNLTQDGFLAIKLNIPPIKEQKEIIRIVDGLLENEQKAKELCDVIDNIDLMKKSILARAFRGELSTNNPNEKSALELLKEVLMEQVG